MDTELKTAFTFHDLKDVLTKFDFEFRDNYLKFSPGKKKVDLQIKKRQPQESLEPASLVKEWTIFSDGRIEGEMHLDISRLVRNLAGSVSRFFGTKSECHVTIPAHNKLHISVLCIQPSTKAQERGYGALPMADELPIGTFGFQLEILPSNFGITIHYCDLYCLGYTPPDFILNAPKWIRTAMGVEGIADEIPTSFNINEIFVPFSALLFSNIEAKNTERRRALQAIQEWKEKTSEKQDIIMGMNDDRHLVFKSVSLSDINHIPRIPMFLLKIREQVRSHRSFELDFSEGRWSVVSEYLSNVKLLDNNYYLQLRAAYFAMMTRTPNKHIALTRILSASPTEIEPLSARVRLTSSPEAKLSLLSRQIKQFAVIWPDAESDPYIGQVFSEFLGDLWRLENKTTANQCYDRALEYTDQPGRLLRKKKDLFLELGDEISTLEILDKLIEIEPRKIEISKLLLEKTDILLKNLKIEESCSTALKALSFDRHSFSAIKALSTALIKSEKFSESIRVLDEFIEEAHPSFSARQKAELHATVADIWASFLDAPEIALGRLVLATNLDQERPEYLHRLANMQDMLGRMEDQAKSLELYVAIMTRQDNPDQIRWANERLNQIYASDNSSLVNQKSLHLNRLLQTTLVSFKEIKHLAKSFTRAEDWKAIIDTIMSRLMEVETDLERGRIFDFFADQSEIMLGDLDLAGQCRRKAFENSFISIDTFDYNYNLFKSNGDLKALGQLCVQWLDLGFSDRIETLRECIESEYFIDDDLLDQWALMASELDHVNCDLIQSRLFAHLRNRNDHRILAMWQKIQEIDIGPLRRKKLFDGIADFLIEAGHYPEIKEAFHWFASNGEDPLQVSFEAIGRLRDKVPDRDLLDFILIILNHGETPHIDLKRTSEILRSDPKHLRQFFGVLAQNSSDMIKKSEYIVSAINLAAINSPSPIEICVVNNLLGLPLSSEWYGVQKLSRLLEMSEFERPVYFYLKFWTPLLLDEERQYALLLLLDLMAKSIEDPAHIFASLESIITGNESETIIHKIAFLADRLDDDTFQIFVSKFILDSSAKNVLFVKAMIVRNSKKFIDFALAMKYFGKDIEEQTITYADFFEALQNLASPMIWQEVQNRVEATILEDAGILDPNKRNIPFYLIRKFVPIGASFQRFLESSSSFAPEDIDARFGYLLDAIEEWPKDNELLNALESATWECTAKTQSVSLLSRLENLTYVESPQNQWLLCDALNRLQQTEMCKDLADRILVRIHSGVPENDVPRDVLEKLQSYLGNGAPHGLQKGDLDKGEILLSSSPQGKGSHESVLEAAPPAVHEAFEGEEDSLASQGSDKNLISGALSDIPSTSSGTLLTFGEDLEATSVESRPSITAANWRELARNNQLRPGDLMDLWGQDFPNQVTQHISVQVVAILTGQIDRLKDWRMPVWRNRSSGNYPLMVGNRYPENQLSPSLVGPMAKILMELNHFLSLVYRERLLVQPTANPGRHLEEDFSQDLVPINWNSPIIVRSGISCIKERFDNRQLTFASLANLGKNIYFDLKSRQIIFDESYYHRMPPSHLFHGLLLKFWEIKTKFQVYFLIDPIKELWPLMTLLVDFIGEKKISRDVLSATVHNSKGLGDFLDKIDFKKVSYHLNELGTFRQSDFLKTYFAMQTHLYRIVAAETLDIVGLLEFITGYNLIDSRDITLHDLFKSSRYFQPLFKFVLHLEAEIDNPQAMDMAL